MNSGTYLVRYSYINTCNSAKKEDTTFYYADKKIDDCNIEEAKATIGAIANQVEQEVRKKLHLGADSSVQVTIWEINLLK